MTEQNKNEELGMVIDLYDEIEKWYSLKGVSTIQFFRNNSTEYARELMIEDFSLKALDKLKSLEQEIEKLQNSLNITLTRCEDRDQEISRLKAEIVEVRGYNCDLADENRRIQEQCEILIESADCRGDEDCDHCEAVRVCKPCQLEIEIIEAMKKELGSLEQENERLKKQTAVKRCMACGNIAMTNHGCEIMDQLKERDELIKECIPYLKCDYSNKALNYDENVKIQKLAEKARKMVGEK